MKPVFMLLGVALLALLVGAAATGLPDPVSNDVRMSDIPASPGTADATAEVLTLPPPAATAGELSTTTIALTRTAGRTTPTVSPLTAPIVVANGSGVPGLAGETAQDLEAAGFAPVVAADAQEAVATSVVYYAPSGDVVAASVAEVLGISDVRPRPPTRLTVGDEPGLVWVMLGADRA